MNLPPKAAFRFDDYTFTRFEFNEPEDHSYEGLSILIEPTGVFSKSDKNFNLTLNFSAAISDDGNTIEDNVVSLTMKCVFVLAEGVDEIPDFFYLNSIAIAFPYLRSFISTLTLQAHCKLLMLPILNLTHLEGRLRDNTTTID